MTIFNKSSRKLIFGGLFFIIPLLLFIAGSKHTYDIFRPIGIKLSSQFGLNTLFGKSSALIVTLFILITLCFLAGLLIEKGLVRNWSSNLEKKLFVFLPSLQMLKFRLIGDNNTVINEIWEAVIFKEDSFYRIGFITEKTGNHTTVYIPDAPKIDAGEVRYMMNSEFECYPISMKEAMSTIYSFGEGLDIDNIIASSKKV